MEETVDLSPYAIFEMMERLDYADLKRFCSSYTGLRDLCEDPIAIEIIRKKKREMLERSYRRQLNAMAYDQRIPGYSRLRRSELINLLEETDV